MEAIMEATTTEVTIDNNACASDVVETNVPCTEDTEGVDNGCTTKKSKYANKKKANTVRFDFETGYVLLRVSSSTEPRKLGGAIFKNFKDGCKALVVSFIGKDATVQALKGISVANVYLENSSDEEKGALVGKTLCISPRFYTFETEIGDATTTKIIIYAVDSKLIQI